VDTIAQSGTCDALTNLWVAAGVGAISVAAIVPDLVAAPAMAGGEAAADSSIKVLATRLAEKAISGKQFAAQFTKDTVKTGVAIGGATLIAKLIVMSQMGATHNSLAAGESYDNDADAGTNIYANQVQQQQFYGAPLPDSELGADNAANQKFLAAQESRKSTFERYASVNNPNSLLSQLGLRFGSYLSTSGFSSVPQMLSSLLNPVRSFGSVLGPFINNTSFADANVTSANTYYGNIQFGYTKQEKALMASDPSYSMLENQQILEASGQTAAIKDKYGKCFDGSESLGEMLANGDIQRDSDGNVKADAGLCSLNNLTFTNNEFGVAMVFRYRVSNNYNNALDQLSQMQVVTKSSDPSASSDPIEAASGNAQQLAQQILANKNVTYDCGSSGQDDIKDAAAGKPGTAGAPLNPEILKLIATIGQTHQVCVSALESYHQGHSSDSYHYTGDAVDFGNLDGVYITGRNAPAQTIIKIAEDVLPKGTAFGQQQCGPSPPLPAGFSQFNDGCDHLHVQVAR
jgi:hypothetical protein